MFIETAWLLTSSGKSEMFQHFTLSGDKKRQLSSYNISPLYGNVQFKSFRELIK